MRQAERDRLEGVDIRLREAIDRAKVAERMCAVTLCPDCGCEVRAWKGIADIEGGRLCQVDAAARVMGLLGMRGAREGER